MDPLTRIHMVFLSDPQMFSRASRLLPNISKVRPPSDRLIGSLWANWQIRRINMFNIFAMVHLPNNRVLKHYLPIWWNFWKFRFFGILTKLRGLIPFPTKFLELFSPARNLILFLLIRYWLKLLKKTGRFNTLCEYFAWEAPEKGSETGFLTRISTNFLKFWQSGLNHSEGTYNVFLDVLIRKKQFKPISRSFGWLFEKFDFLGPGPPIWPKVLLFSMTILENIYLSFQFIFFDIR